MSKIVIGIDPGAKGGIAVLETAADGSLIVMAAEAAPTCAFELHMFGNRMGFFFREHECHAFLERVHAMLKQGVSSMFTFGRSVGMWEGFLGCWGIKCDYVEPQVWQKITAPMAGLTTKDRSIRFASVAFPDTPLVPKGGRKPSDGIADALCIAYYGAKRVRAK
ncbi:hypothetical protein [Cloacibacillus sp.]|uniref:hypothetical protein n=1 Tax=Cloacibacillus sp. TaxID=2049023 RepID=UPI0025B820E8|nr:hypothetical protein [Cloacibacillus sp.]MCC8056415.1 hypothetical protein [Cloacibacillus sp.]